jgi:L-threonylcarbamoyladenylate synthase
VSGLEVLRRGGVVLLATDTLPGLHALATHPGAAEALRSCKQSPPDRPFLLLFSSLDEVLRYGEPGSTRHLAALRRAWPGPVTALLNPTPLTPDSWTLDGDSLAARVPAREELRALIEELDAPLFSTSANHAGEEPARSMDEAASRFPEIPLLLSGEDGVEVEASTLVDLTGEEALVLRQGTAVWPPSGAA